MPFDVTNTMRAIQSHLAAAGYFRHVQIGEPKAAPSQRFTAAIFMEAIEPHDIPLATICALYKMVVRVYDNMTHEPQEDVELEMSIVVDKVMNDLSGDFTLGGTVRGIDVSQLRTQWSYLDVDRTMYRIADISIPIIVNDVATLSP